MDRYGMVGNLAVVALRLVISTVAATALWYGFESQILKLKRYFQNTSASSESGRSRSRPAS
jgi:peptidoglycan/LPS O-acetylase OafA/YrhL